MNKDRAMQLADALESGEFEQGKHALERGGKFCCIGVASFLAAKDGACKRVPQSDGSTLYMGVKDKFDQSSTQLIPSVYNWLGLKQPYSGNIYFPGNTSKDERYGYDDTSAMGMNDSSENQRSFKYIAQRIRDNWEEL